MSSPRFFAFKTELSFSCHKASLKFWTVALMPHNTLRSRTLMSVIMFRLNFNARLHRFSIEFKLFLKEKLLATECYIQTVNSRFNYNSTLNWTVWYFKFRLVVSLTNWWPILRAVSVAFQWVDQKNQISWD